MSSPHVRKVCTCGAVIQNCRCLDHVDVVVVRGCATCKARWGTR